jgi:hypothetical protein
MSILSEFTFGEIEKVLADNPALRGFIQGYLAELALMKRLAIITGIKDVQKIPDKDIRKGDILFRYKGTDLTIEVKSVRSGSVKEDVLHETWEGTVGCKSSDKKEQLTSEGILVNTSSIMRGTFDILAISTYTVEGTWDYVYMENKHLPSISHGDHNIIKTSFKINPLLTPLLESDLVKVLESARADKLK